MAKVEVKHVRFHDAVQIAGTVLTSLSSERHASNLGGNPIELLPMGVAFVFNGLRMLVPYPNTPFIELFPEESAAPAAAKGKPAA